MHLPGTAYRPALASFPGEFGTKLLVFALLSLLAVYFSRRSLFSPRSHGFYRFFAWECILGLFVLNFGGFAAWFGDPFAVHQIISWFLMVVCIVPVVQGTRMLRKEGKRSEERDDDEGLLDFEKTSRLVTEGIYAYIRHPMYSSLLLLSWGVFFKAPSAEGGLLALAATAFLFATAVVEEKEDIRFFGDVYRDYMRTTKRFIPFVV